MSCGVTLLVSRHKLKKMALGCKLKVLSVNPAGITIDIGIVITMIIIAINLSAAIVSRIAIQRESYYVLVKKGEETKFMGKETMGKSIEIEEAREMRRCEWTRVVSLNQM